MESDERQREDGRWSVEEGKRKSWGGNGNINKTGPSSKLNMVIHAFLGRNEDLVPTALSI